MHGRRARQGDLRGRHLDRQHRRKGQTLRQVWAEGNFRRLVYDTSTCCHARDRPTRVALHRSRKNCLLAETQAATLACTTGAIMTNLANGPAKMGMSKEIGMANADMSNGKIRSACMHYMKAQKMSVMK
jgi:hypothetical protein